MPEERHDGDERSLMKVIEYQQRTINLLIERCVCCCEEHKHRDRDRDRDRDRGDRDRGDRDDDR